MGSNVICLSTKYLLSCYAEESLKKVTKEKSKSHGVLHMNSMVCLSLYVIHTYQMYFSFLCSADTTASRGEVCHL